MPPLRAGRESFFFFSLIGGPQQAPGPQQTGQHSAALQQHIVCSYAFKARVKKEATKTEGRWLSCVCSLRAFALHAYGVLSMHVFHNCVCVISWVCWRCKRYSSHFSLVLRLRKTRSHLLLDKISEEFYIAILTLNSAIDIKF